MSSLTMFLAGAVFGCGLALLIDGRRWRARAAAGLAPTVAPTPVEEPPVHEIQIHDVTCMDGHQRVGVYCPRCAVGGGLCWGPGLTNRTRAAALAHVVAGLRRQLPGAPHVLPEGTAIEVSVEDLPS